MEDNTDAILESCRLDLGKPAVETFLSEIDFLKIEILYVCNNLHKWMRDEAVPDVPLTQRLASPRVRKEPLGAVLIIGAYNYPLNVLLGPLLGAIAAGNTAVLKPSEQTPHVAMVAARILARLDPDCFACVQGGVPETTALLDRRFDKIFYTGGQAVGRIVAKKAAEHLTPVTLELGGRNPSFVTGAADVRLAARRLLWAKTMNAGQTCISPNYVLVDAATEPLLVAELRAAHQEFYPAGARASPDYARVATPRAWRRLKGLLDATAGEIVVGGSMDEGTRFLEPTIVRVTSADDPLIQEETFGPILTLLAVPSLAAALRVANAVDPTPLAASAFGTAHDATVVLDGIRSGGATRNDAMFHAVGNFAPFGGVGTSGQGSYRGRHSFECFSHRRSVAAVPGWVEGALSIRYPPFTRDKVAKLRGLAAGRPNFDREGRVVVTWWRRLVAGGGLGMAGVLREFEIRCLA